MNSEYYKGKALLISLSALEDITKSTSSTNLSHSSPNLDVDNGETSQTPDKILEDIKSSCGPIDPRLEWGLSQLPDTLRRIEQFESENRTNIPLQHNSNFFLQRVAISIGGTVRSKHTQETDLCGSWGGLRRSRKRLSSSSKELLEKIFLVKQSPNRRERELIAGKCGVTPLQIRVWVCTRSNPICQEATLKIKVLT
ncbi:hypothetical protein KGF57_003063 [Candida theae]|uniref:Homeobox domain-containing protein n=1 Tax=Candida theae TaxID=1198502 RepID=A0AAD5BEU3_9ASCO|nr:uncharacterized protein KGF57_003063 [Candida theae]KAI5957796.1 hypothetical protein KGF57_003063 [Candida theae]